LAEVCLCRAIVYPTLLVVFQYLRIADKEEAMILETFRARAVSRNCISDRLSYLVGHEAVSSLPMGPLLLGKHWERVMIVYSQGSRYSACIVGGDIQNKQDHPENGETW
jgi:hypothetical protein